MTKRRFGGWTMTVLAVGCALALSGWPGMRELAGASEGSASAAEAFARGAAAEALPGGADAAAEPPIDDVAALERLADGIVEPERRLWVVTVRGADGMERYAGGDAAEARRWMEATAERIAGDPAYAAPFWSVNVQGLLPAGADIADVPPHVEQTLQARAKESYEQPNTFSYAYETSVFRSELRSGSGAIRAMAAAHLDTETNRWRVTLGTPAILIEY